MLQRLEKALNVSEALMQSIHFSSVAQLDEHIFTSSVIGPRLPSFAKSSLVHGEVREIYIPIR